MEPPPPPDGAPMAAALVLDRVSVVVTDGTMPRPVLSDVDLVVRAGEMVAVMGPSGAGKSTLVNVACGLVSPTTGRVRLVLPAAGPDEMAPTPPRPSRAWWAARRRSSIGVVHQRRNLLDGLSALDNVALALDLDGVSHRAARAAARAALERVGIEHVADAAAEKLSVGEQQRVAIARAIAADRPILLADEPSAALDRTAADRIVGLLADLARDRAVLLVTHDAQQASWADRTIVLRDGRIVDEVAPATPRPS